jgi:hypothetical protein
MQAEQMTLMDLMEQQNTGQQAWEHLDKESQQKTIAILNDLICRTVQSKNNITRGEKK